MCKRLIFLSSFVLLLALAGNSSAATRWFYGGGDSVGLWNTASEWYGGVPTASDIANLNTAGVVCIIDANHTGGSAAVCDTLWLPDYQSNTGYCYLDMTGGTLTVTNNMEMGRWGTTVDDLGMLSMSGGTINVGGELHVGGKHGTPATGGTGTINICGGKIDVDGALKVPVTDAKAGAINFYGGIIEAGSISMNSDGLIDITEGTLIIDGNVVSTINTYVTSSYITAHNGDANVIVDYNTTDDQTHVTSDGIDLLIACLPAGDRVKVYFDASSEPNLVRLFGLDVTVSSGTITAATALNSDYWVHPGSIVIINEEVTNYGTPVASGDLPGTLAGLDSNGVTFELASLYRGDSNAPDTSCILSEFTVDSDCNITVSENAIRNCVVLENKLLPGIYSPGCSLDQ